jgi:hypothetical protein
VSTPAAGTPKTPRASARANKGKTADPNQTVPLAKKVATPAVSASAKKSAAAKRKANDQAAIDQAAIDQAAVDQAAALQQQQQQQQQLQQQQQQQQFQQQPLGIGLPGQFQQLGGGVGAGILPYQHQGITLADVTALLAKQRQDDSADLDRRVAAKIAVETKRIEAAAQQQIDAVYAAAQDQGQGQGYAHSTPGPSGAGRRVGFAPPHTPVVAGHGYIDLDLDAADADEEEEPELSAQVLATGVGVVDGVGVVTPISALAAATATKRDAKPHPMSFWQDRIERPVGLGAVGGHEQTFAGKRNDRLS